MGEVVIRLQRFDLLDLPIISEGLNDYVAQREDATLLDFTPEHPWHWLIPLLTIAPGFNLLKRLEILASTHPAPLTFPTEIQAGILENMRQRCNFYADTPLFAYDNQDTPTILCALTTDNTHQHQSFAELFEMGFPGSLPPRLLDRTDAILLTRDLDITLPMQWPLFTRDHITKASKKLRLSPTEIRQRLQVFIPFGAEIEEETP